MVAGVAREETHVRIILPDICNFDRVTSFRRVHEFSERSLLPADLYARRAVTIPCLQFRKCLVS